MRRLSWLKLLCGRGPRAGYENRGSRITETLELNLEKLKKYGIKILSVDSIKREIVLWKNRTENVHQKLVAVYYLIFGK